MQTDPILHEGGMNLYAYVGNDPVNDTDATGLEDNDPMLALLMHHDVRTLRDWRAEFSVGRELPRR